MYAISLHWNLKSQKRLLSTATFFSGLYGSPWWASRFLQYLFVNCSKNRTKCYWTKVNFTSNKRSNVLHKTAAYILQKIPLTTVLRKGELKIWLKTLKSYCAIIRRLVNFDDTSLWNNEAPLLDHLLDIYGRYKSRNHICTLEKFLMGNKFPWRILYQLLRMALRLHSIPKKWNSRCSRCTLCYSSAAFGCEKFKWTAVPISATCHHSS